MSTWVEQGTAETRRNAADLSGRFIGPLTAGSIDALAGVHLKK